MNDKNGKNKKVKGFKTFVSATMCATLASVVSAYLVTLDAEQTCQKKNERQSVPQVKHAQEETNK